MSLFLKDPGASLDYAIDWTDALPPGGGLVSAEWSIAPAEPGGLSGDGGRIEGARAILRLSGGVPGRVYRAACRAGFPDGSVDERTLVIRVEER